MFKGLLNIACSMTKNIAFSRYYVHMLCARCIRPPGLQCGVGRDDPGSGQSDCWQTSAKSKSRDFLFDLIKFYILIDILIHLTQIVAEPRIIVFQHFVCRRLLLVNLYQCCVWCSAAKKLTPESCCKPRHSPRQTCRKRFQTFQNSWNVSNTSTCLSALARLKQVLWLWPRNMDRSAVHIRWVVCARGARANAKSVP